ncbi:MAG: AmmeMemoRadiSam system protein A [Terriglobales bacterium]
MSKPFENLTASEDADCVRQAPEYSPEQRKVLLAIAHQAIASRIAGKPMPGQLPFSPVSPNPWAALEEPRGVFTTLYLQGDLRGCVGYVAAMRPLFQAVAETACAAAFEDSRFLPVTPEEAPALKISLSVLSQLFPIKAAQVEVGRHGLVISDGIRRGLLLPQVPVEHGWDRETFLEQTCRKAGLPVDAWRESATIEAFVAEVFGEDEVSD